MEVIRPGQYRHLVPKYQKVAPIELAKNSNGKVIRDVAASARLQEIEAGLEPFSGEFTDRHLAHLIKRISFGVKPDELNRFRNSGIGSVLDHFFTNNFNYPEPVNNYNMDSDNIDPEVPERESFVLAKFDNEFEGDRIVSMKAWMIGRILNSQSSIQEKMILFWWSYLPIKMWDVFISKNCYRYFKMLEKHSLGNFKELIRDLTIDPAMLIFLSGAFNNKNTPDENFARELQELFCVGKGKDARYTEEDVRMVARVLTGWTIDWESIHSTGAPQSIFDPEMHHTGEKRFSAFYGNKVIQGREGADGAQELDELLDMIFATSECAKHIARKIYAFFVSTEISESAERNVITPLSQVIRQNNYDIEPALRVLFSSAHFYHPYIIGVMIKNPLDFTLGFWKIFEMKMASNFQEEKEMYSGILWQTANIGMEIGDPPNVAGWTPYYQTPMYDKIWINTDTIAKRIFLCDAMIFWGYRLSNSQFITADILEFVKKLDKPEDPNALIQEASVTIMGVELTESYINLVKQILLSGQDMDYYWTGAWLSYMDNPSDLESKNVVLNRLNPAFQRLLQLAETQLM
ncbi:DUF1800 domain-containing protein [Shivajiella indica]|uniref:DUF1800 family protein n=1 Tax=Shivajiella indica TaxID=872115 RepID=A0ABW5B6K5_9BACT